MRSQRMFLELILFVMVLEVKCTAAVLNGFVVGVETWRSGVDSCGIGGCTTMR